jgi:hypothetical protein
MMTVAAKPRTSLEVRAVKIGSYPDPGELRAKIRNPGDVFTLRSVKEFAGVEDSPFGWMEWLDEVDKDAKPAKPIPATTVPNVVRDPLMGRIVP